MDTGDGVPRPVGSIPGRDGGRRLWVEFRSVSIGVLVAGAPLYLGFVALPSLLPLAAARAGVMRAAVLVLMTGVAVLAVATDDAQAGLAVFLVPYVAVPLAALLWIGQAVAASRAVENVELCIRRTGHGSGRGEDRPRKARMFSAWAGGGDPGANSWLRGRAPHGSLGSAKPSASATRTASSRTSSFTSSSEPV